MTEPQPSSVIRIPQAELAGLIAQGKLRITTPSPQSNERASQANNEIIDKERSVLKDFYGEDIDVPDMPQQLVDTLKRLEQEGITCMEPHYLSEQFLFDLNLALAENKVVPIAHPGWNVKPEDWFWTNAARGGAFSPQAADVMGNWILIDSTPKPNYQNGAQLYTDDPFRDILPNGSRFNLSWDTIKTTVFPQIAEKLGVPVDKMRFPKAIEFNVLGNMHHKEWGETSTYEWFEDGFGAVSRLIGGHSGLGGLANVFHNSSASPDDRVGFRPLIVF